MEVFKAPIHWRQCRYVSMANAARISGRGPGWVREAITVGTLSAVRLPTGGPPVVKVQSLLRLLDAAEPLKTDRVPAAGGVKLRLAASNP
ncbi:hypothetical protein GCM10007928_43030 [Sulfitobacter porphyrae]|nr:hypothetical protein GCM10007928_43030 [Sulfitobacter porphyrae]